MLIANLRRQELRSASCDALGDLVNTAAAWAIVTSSATGAGAAGLPCARQRSVNSWRCSVVARSHAASQAASWCGVIVPARATCSAAARKVANVIGDQASGQRGTDQRGGRAGARRA